MNDCSLGGRRRQSPLRGDRGQHLEEVFIPRPEHQEHKIYLR